MTDIPTDTVAWFIRIDHLILDDGGGSFAFDFGLLVVFALWRSLAFAYYDLCAIFLGLKDPLRWLSASRPPSDPS